MSLIIGFGKRKVTLRNPFRQRRLEQRVGNLEYKIQSQEFQLQLFWDLIVKMGEKVKAGDKKPRIIVKGG